MIHNKIIARTLLIIATASLVGCGEEKADKPTNIEEKMENILLQEWTGSFGGVPAFDLMKVEDIKPAIEKGMEMKLSDIDAITNNEEAPTFENIIEELERSGAELERAFNYYGIFSANMSSPEFRDIQAELAPKISEFSSKITQNEKLFVRIKAVYDASQTSPLEAYKQRVVDLTYKSFEMNGAELSPEKKERYAAISKELSSLYTKFSNNVLHDEENYITYLTEEQLGGLTEGFIKSAAKIAADNGKEGMYAITNSRSSMDPFLTYSTERELRKKVWTNYYSRGDNGDEYDNNTLIAEVLQLRRKKVEILGYKNFAEWRLQDRMAKTPENAIGLMQAVWPAAIARVLEEVEYMQVVADNNGDEITIEAWDYRFYSEKVRKEKYNLDESTIKPYLSLDNVLEGVYSVAGRLFDFTFTPITDGSIPVFQEDVKVWEVTNKVW